MLTDTFSCTVVLDCFDKVRLAHALVAAFRVAAGRAQLTVVLLCSTFVCIDLTRKTVHLVIKQTNIDANVVFQLIS